MIRAFRFSLICLLASVLLSCVHSGKTVREVQSFNSNWLFMLGDDSLAYKAGYNDANWRKLNLPHDWSIEGAFSEEHPTNQAGGALPAGIGWYRKTFVVPESMTDKMVRIEFDGIYRNSEVWINSHYLGKRPFGYISFQYDITPYLNKVGTPNTIAVKVDNDLQPNSRWYTGSGIYRDVRLVALNPVHIAHWGTFVSTPMVTEKSANVNLKITVENASVDAKEVHLLSTIYDNEMALVSKRENIQTVHAGTNNEVDQSFIIGWPNLWSPESPSMYTIHTQVVVDGKLLDDVTTPLGIRTFRFDAEKGFFLNGKSTKIKGVCLHHDLGALGAAYNRRANQRQLEIMKKMGCNAIRTAHNPFDPQFYDLCDKMGFLVMDEAFDVWKKKKAKKDYHLEFEAWHKRDLQDMVLRDRNHPSIIMYSCGNEIREQFDSTGIEITRELVKIIKELDTTRPVTNALTENQPEKNYIYQSDALDVLGFNYKHEVFDSLYTLMPDVPIIASESVSAIATRGQYDMPSDSLRIWPPAHNVDFKGNADYTVSAYDNAYAYWGTTHETNWRMIKKHAYVAGMFLWTGFDYIGEPVPYPYPARSSYLGVVDLAGFPKDAYYMYQSEWSDEAMLHVFPHWNWKPGQMVDIWAYYNKADEVELFVNGKSKGVQKKGRDDFHVMWRVPFEKGTIKVVSRKDGATVLEKDIKTAGKPAKIELTADRVTMAADGKDLSFVTVRITDEKGNLVPEANNLVQFTVSGSGFVAGVDNGYQASLEPFKAKQRKAFKGMCLAIIQNNGESGEIVVNALSKELEPAVLHLHCE